MSKRALVFGHTSGLGLAVCNELLDKGFSVVGIARSENKSRKDLVNIKADLSKKSDLEKVIQLIKNEYQVFDVLVYCSGTLTAHSMDSLVYEEMDYLYKVNTFAPMFIESKLLPLIKANGTYVANVTSSALIDYYPKFAEYSSAKAAFAKFTKDLQKELLETKARAMDICAGAFQSNIYKTMTGDKIDRDESKAMKASDLAALIVYALMLPENMEVAYLWVNRK